MPTDHPNELRNGSVHGTFRTTRWSRVILAGDEDHPEAMAALSGLCQDYWRPLYYFARRKGHSPEAAKDLTQGFIAGLLQTNGVVKADRERGRFRTFLISAFCNYLANQHRDQNALKRGGGDVVLSLDGDVEAVIAQQAIDTMTPEVLYERSWAFALLERVMERLRAEYMKAGREPLFVTIQPHLSGAAGRPGYARLGEQLGMSESAVTVAMHRMRRRYGELLREEIGETVTMPEDIEDELRHLMRVVSSSGGNG